MIASVREISNKRQGKASLAYQQPCTQYLFIMHRNGQALLSATSLDPKKKTC